MTQSTMLNQQGLFDHQDHHQLANNQMGFFINSYPPIKQLAAFSSSLPSSSFGSDSTNLSETLIPPSLVTHPQKHREAHITSDFERSHLLSLHQRPSANLWAWGDHHVSENPSSKKRSSSSNDLHDNHDVGLLGVSSSATKMKKIKTTTKMKKIKTTSIRRKVRDPRFCFKTLSEVDVLNDGYKWRKYGQKVVKNTHHPRSYYRCTKDNCRVKKRVERLAEDPRMVITTYEGRHAHSPSHDDDLEDSESPNHRLNNFFW